MNNKIHISNKTIGNNSPCFIIAEGGVNHNGNLDIAKKLVDKAIEINCDCIKFQLFRSDLLVTDITEQAEYSKRNTKTNISYKKLLEQIEIGEEEHRILKHYCDMKKIIFLSTPHCGKWSVDVLEKLNVAAFKIGSGDITNLPFLDYVSKLKKPIILSTGMANLHEIDEAVQTIQKNDCKLIILQCTTNYPVDLTKVNLRVMETFRKRYKCPVGFSDHTRGIEASLVASCIGAQVIEKHFTLDKNMEGPDHKASTESNEFSKLIKYIRIIEKEKIKSPKEAFEFLNENYNVSFDTKKIELILGTGKKVPYEKELKIAEIARKSIITARSIQKGKIIEADDLIIKRPGTGILPKYYTKIIGRMAKIDISKDTLLKWSMIS